MQTELFGCLNQKDYLWRQRSRVKWLKDGDRNTKFFHSMVKYRKGNVIILNLEIEGEIIQDQERIADHIVNFYSQLFTVEFDDEPPPDFTSMNGLINSRVRDEDVAMLTSIPSQDEVKAIVFAMDRESVPDLDGFGGIFYVKCWETVGQEVTMAIQTFFLKYYLSTGLNSSNVILLPKKDIPKQVSDFRPIVLSNFLFKIISKILSARLGKVVSYILSPN